MPFGCTARDWRIVSTFLNKKDFLTGCRKVGAIERSLNIVCNSFEKLAAVAIKQLKEASARGISPPRTTVYYNSVVFSIWLDNQPQPYGQDQSRLLENEFRRAVRRQLGQKVRIGEILTHHDAETFSIDLMVSTKLVDLAPPLSA